MSSFIDEQLGTGQRYTVCRARDHRDLAMSFPTTTPSTRRADVMKKR